MYIHTSLSLSIYIYIYNNVHISGHCFQPFLPFWKQSEIPLLQQFVIPHRPHQRGPLEESKRTGARGSAFSTCSRDAQIRASAAQFRLESAHFGGCYGRFLLKVPEVSIESLDKFKSTGGP